MKRLFATTLLLVMGVSCGQKDDLERSKLDGDDPEAKILRRASFLIGKIEGVGVSLHLLPEGAMAEQRKFKATRMINVEPGCIMVEAYCKVLDRGRVSIHFPLDGDATHRTMECLSITTKDVIVEYEPADSNNLASKLVAIKPGRRISDFGRTEKLQD